MIMWFACRTCNLRVWGSNPARVLCAWPHTHISPWLSLVHNRRVHKVTLQSFVNYRQAATGSTQAWNMQTHTGSVLKHEWKKEFNIEMLNQIQTYENGWDGSVDVRTHEIVSNNRLRSPHSSGISASRRCVFKTFPSRGGDPSETPASAVTRVHGERALHFQRLSQTWSSQRQTKSDVWWVGGEGSRHAVKPSHLDVLIVTRRRPPPGKSSRFRKAHPSPFFLFLFLLHTKCPSDLRPRICFLKNTHRHAAYRPVLPRGNDFLSGEHQQAKHSLFRLTEQIFYERKLGAQGEKK